MQIVDILIQAARSLLKKKQRLRFANYVEKQPQKHRKVLFNFVHIIYYLSRTLLGKYIILVYNRVVQVIGLLGGR